MLLLTSENTINIKQSGINMRGTDLEGVFSPKGDGPEIYTDFQRMRRVLQGPVFFALRDTGWYNNVRLMGRCTSAKNATILSGKGARKSRQGSGQECRVGTDTDSNIGGAICS